MSTPQVVTSISGDWIGPETMATAERIIAAAGVNIVYERFDCQGPDLSPELLASARRTGVVLKAKLDAQRHKGKLPPTVRLRKELGTWATLRPARAVAGAPARFPALDIVVIRETSEDIYSGFEHEVTEGAYEAVKVTTKAACERIARFAYEYARAHGRKKVTIVHKSNIMKKSDGLFLKTAQAVGAQYPDIQTEDVIVDALCMRLVRWPMSFDVLLAGNLFGDIVGDLVCGLAGGVSASASYSVGDGVALFENPHGEVPEHVGNGKANPIPMVLTAAQMLQHIGETAAAVRIRKAIDEASLAGLRTYDQGGTDGIAEVEAAILARL